MLKPFFSYYGSKYRIISQYPKPLHARIVEPFAGSACFSLHYPDRNVILNDLDPYVSGVWSYLIRTSSEEILRIPETVEHVDELKGPQEQKWLVGFCFARARSKPGLTPSAWMRQHPGDSRFWGAERRSLIALQVNHIRHWKVSQKPYEDVKLGVATYFIDAPYSDLSQTEEVQQVNIEKRRYAKK